MVDFLSRKSRKQDCAHRIAPIYSGCSKFHCLETAIDYFRESFADSSVRFKLLKSESRNFSQYLCKMHFCSSGWKVATMTSVVHKMRVRSSSWQVETAQYHDSQLEVTTSSALREYLPLHSKPAFSWIFRGSFAQNRPRFTSQSHRLSTHTHTHSWSTNQPSRVSNCDLTRLYPLTSKPQKQQRVLSAIEGRLNRKDTLLSHVTNLQDTVMQHFHKDHNYFRNSIANLSRRHLNQHRWSPNTKLLTGSLRTTPIFKAFLMTYCIYQSSIKAGRHLRTSGC